MTLDVRIEIEFYFIILEKKNEIKGIYIKYNGHEEYNLANKPLRKMQG